MHVRLFILFGIVSLAGCTTAQPVKPMAGDDAAGSSVTVYVARRKWHIDVGFAVADLDPSLRPVKTEFAAARYLFFGFGDRHYLLTKSKSKTTPLLLRALWPGPALLLVTAIEDPPEFAFGSSQLLRLQLNAAQAHAIQAFIRASIPDLMPLAAGPYADSAYYPASQSYSALYTCNTWAAEALRAGGERIRSGGVVFAGQLWHQLTRLRDQLQGGLVPS